MKIKNFIFLSILFFVQLALLGVTRFYVKDFFKNNMIVTKRIKSSHSLITFIKYRGASFIIKQKLREHSNFWSIMQAILADVFAHSIENISSQRVRMILKSVYFPTKIHKNAPASLLTIVPGKSIRLWSRTSPRLITEKTKRLLKHFLIKQSKGMNERILQTITKHPDLPPILAIHMLLGFYDGHDGNIFYDQESNRFSIIDMDSSFKKNLVQGSYLFMKKYFAKKRITVDIKKALNVLVDTMELLMKQNPLKKIKTLVVEIANALIEDETGEQQFRKRIMQVVLFLEESYTSAKRLISLIRNGKEVVKSFSKRNV